MPRRPIHRPLAAALAVATLTLAACGTGGLHPVKDSPYAPRSIGGTAASVDGLLVGHRLMEAGEYELALKSYYRAAGDQA